MENSPSEENSVHLRLIPLTSEIKLAMVDFNTPIKDIEGESSKSLIDLVRKEVEHNLQNLESSIEKCVKTEELSEIVNQCIQENLALCSSAQLNNTASTSSTKQVTIQFVEDEPSGEDLVLKENVSILEKRISFLESKLSTIFQLIPRLKKISTHFKNDQQTLQKIDDKCQSSDESSEYTCENMSPSKSISIDINPYDEMYYEWRQNKMNLLHYKHSECSLQLNRKLEMESSHGILPNYSLPAVSKSHVKAKFINSQHLLI